MELVEYGAVRSFFKSGDIIAFGGRNIVSNIVKTALHYPCSHVGIIFTTQPVPGSDQQLNFIIESTSLNNGFSGVQINRMSTHIDAYDGDIWWLPLSDNTRSVLDEDKFFDFLIRQKGKPYDLPQAIASAEDLLLCNKEDFSKLYCSELCAAALEAGCVFHDINASEYTPKDICQENIYAFYNQLKGSPTELPGFNQGGVVV